MIHPILCEVKYDCWFLEEIINRIEPKKLIPLDQDFGKFQKCYRSEYHQNNQSWIILSDGGHDLINKYIPKIISNCFAVNKNNPMHYIVLKDSDGCEPKYLLGIYHKSLSEYIHTKNIKYTDLEIDLAKNTIVLISNRDNRYSFYFHFVFIPQSFEKKLIDKSFDKERSLIKYRTKLEKKDPHDALTVIAESLNIKDKETLIRNSVLNKWFYEEEWYKSLIRCISAIKTL